MVAQGFERDMSLTSRFARQRYYIILVPTQEMPQNFTQNFTRVRFLRKSCKKLSNLASVFSGVFTESSYNNNVNGVFTDSSNCDFVGF